MYPSSNSYTAERLKHATPEHLSITSRSIFIGPIPEGWLNSHRRDWYKHHLGLNYSSRAATFSASADVSRQRRLTALNDEPSDANHGPSFPQPDDIEEEEEGGDGERDTATTQTPPAITNKRSAHPGAVAERNGTTQHAPTRRNVAEELPVTTPEEENNSTFLSPHSHPKPSRQSTPSRSYVTASEGDLTQSLPVPIDDDEQERGGDDSTEGPGAHIIATSSQDAPRSLSVVESQLGTSILSPEPPDADKSTSSLIHREDVGEPVRHARKVSNTQNLLNKVIKSSKVATHELTNEITEDDPVNGDAIPRRKSLGPVHFDISADPRRHAMQVKARVAQVNLRRTAKSFRSSRSRPGEILKTERMLIRVDTTLEKLPDDYDENGSQKIQSRTVQKWREYMVVCREIDDEDGGFLLQIYKTRVIPELESGQVKKKSKYEVVLSRRTARCNLFSSLDKSIVVWTPVRSGYTIFIMKPHSSADSVEWYTFLRNILGWKRAREVHVNVPDLSLNLHLENPFEELEKSQEISQAAEGDDAALVKVLESEQAVASNIVQRCVEMLEKSPDYHTVLREWTQGRRLGLAWKRYDRLEWIFGENEQKMYGTIAMLKSHDLELRPKEHYPTTIKTKKGKTLKEPAPVEGFLIRLTTQKGSVQKFGRLFYKRLYFSTHDEFLVFSRPAKAVPPPPPKLPATTNAQIPSSREISDKMPIIYAVNPYPVQEGKVAWLAPGHQGTSADRQRHDAEAQDEHKRKVDILLNCDGYIDLSDVVKVRKFHPGAALVDDDIDEGSDVDFDAPVPDSLQDDGTTTEVDDDRTFELVLKNELVIRLQAFDKMTKKEWIRRLRDLVKYWKYRKTADINLYKSVRRQNLEQLQIDEEYEAILGQFARKWELPKSFASPELYHMCGISGCRSVHHSGHLFRKPHRHSTFSRCAVMLVEGQLLMFQDSLRTRSGKKISHIHHEKFAAVDLQDCYLYSGLLTEGDLLYQNRTFDSNKPGHHALPRIYLEDGWTSTDEDYMTCFVIWYSGKKSFFRSQDTGRPSEAGAGSSGTSRRTRFKRVSQLGVKGTSMVFKARSRAERDHWVLAISVAMEKVAQDNEVRITPTQG